MRNRTGAWWPWLAMGLWACSAFGRSKTPSSAPPPPVATVRRPVHRPPPVTPVTPAPPPAQPPGSLRLSEATELAGTRVVHLGDSFVHAGLSQRLRVFFEALGVRYVARSIPSSNTLDWAARLSVDVAQLQPDLLILTLGANEIASSYPDLHARAIQRLVAQIGDRPCVWTTPPLWRPERGFFDTLQANVAPCRFFETDAVLGEFLPRSDGVHPTAEAGARWADALIDYLGEERVGAPERPWNLEAAPAAERTPRGLRSPLAATR
ncbi:MAG: GDSL-type esterase/lipase family protein [Myxococcota bacterium]